MVRRQVEISYNFERIKKKLDVYERSQSKFAGKKALTRLNKELKGKNGLVAKTYKKGRKGERFIDPVSFTLNSTFGVQRGLDLEVGVKDEKALKGKGNPASKYLYPTIGGGTTKAYSTNFTKYLKDTGLLKTSEYPFANLDKEVDRYIRRNKRGRVSRNTYRNTINAIEQPKPHGSKGGKLQDAKVFVLKSERRGLKAGIYREVPRRDGKFTARALFFFGKTPRQSGKKTFSQRIKGIADERVFKYWIREIKILSKDNKFYDA